MEVLLLLPLPPKSLPLRKERNEGGIMVKGMVIAGLRQNVMGEQY